jgi:hypothetical protein
MDLDSTLQPAPFNKHPRHSATAKLRRRQTSTTHTWCTLRNVNAHAYAPLPLTAQPSASFRQAGLEQRRDSVVWVCVAAWLHDTALRTRSPARVQAMRWSHAAQYLALLLSLASTCHGARLATKQPHTERDAALAAGFQQVGHMYIHSSVGARCSLPPAASCKRCAGWLQP